MINKREYFGTQYLIAKALFMGLGFKILLKFSGAHLWLCVILGTFIGLIINKLMTYVKHKYLTYFSSIILLAIGLLLFMKMVYDIYLKASFYNILFPVILLIIYTGRKKRDTIFKVSSILMVIEICALAFITIFLIPHIDIMNFALEEFEEGNVFITSLLFACYTTFPNFLLTDFRSNYNYKAYLLACFSIFIFAILITGALSVDIALLTDYPEYFLLKRIYIPNFIENVEGIIYMTWLIVFYPFLTLAYKNIRSLLIDS